MIPLLSYSAGTFSMFKQPIITFIPPISLLNNQDGSSNEVFAVLSCVEGTQQLFVLSGFCPHAPSYPKTVTPVETLGHHLHVYTEAHTVSQHYGGVKSQSEKIMSSTHLKSAVQFWQNLLMLQFLVKDICRRSVSCTVKDCVISLEMKCLL